MDWIKIVKTDPLPSDKDNLLVTDGKNIGIQFNGRRWSSGTINITECTHRIDIELPVGDK